MNSRIILGRNTISNIQLSLLKSISNLISWDHAVEKWFQWRPLWWSGLWRPWICCETESGSCHATCCCCNSRGFLTGLAELCVEVGWILLLPIKL